MKAISLVAVAAVLATGCGASAQKIGGTPVNALGDVRVTQCGVDSVGYAVADLKIYNASGVTAQYVITVAVSVDGKSAGNAYDGDDVPPHSTLVEQAHGPMLNTSNVVTCVATKALRLYTNRVLGS